MKQSNLSETISFRIDAGLAARLKRKALAERLSLHSYAREIFLDAISQLEMREQLAELQQDMADMGDEMREFRQVMTSLLYKLVVEMSDLEPDELAEWMDGNGLSED